MSTCKLQMSLDRVQFVFSENITSVFIYSKFHEKGYVIQYLLIERFSHECRKTKTKVITLITLANQKGRRQSGKPIKPRRNYT